MESDWQAVKMPSKRKSMPNGYLISLQLDFVLYNFLINHNNIAFCMCRRFSAC